MNDEEESYGRLLESLQTEVVQTNASAPPFTSYGGGAGSEWWDWWGAGSYQVPHRWNPKNYSDIEYHNSEGKLHRIYGPAYVSRLYNIQAWYKDGIRHRENGPAYIHNANMAWFYEGELHNLNGPAVVEGAGPRQYWISGVKYSKKQYHWEIKRRKRKGLIK